MDQLGIRPGEFEQCTKILIILPSGTYRDFSEHHRYSLGERTARELMSLLRTEAVRLNNWDTPHRKMPNTFYNSDNGRGGGGRGGQRGRGGRGRGGRGGRAPIICYRCWEPEHISRNCPNEARPVPAKYSHLAERSTAARLTASNIAMWEQPTEEKNNVEVKFTCALLTASNSDIDVQSMCPQHTNCVCLGVDSCTSDHIFKDLEMFTILTPVAIPVVSNTACDGTVIATHVGKAKFPIVNTDGLITTLTIKKAYYAPTIAINLFSTTRFGESTGGYIVCTATGATAFDSFNNRIFDTDIREGVPMAHVLLPTDIEEGCRVNTFANVTKGELWHCRFVNLSHKILTKMLKQKTVQDFDNEPISPTVLDPCEACPMEKLATQKFSRTHTPREDTAGRYWMTDLTGPFRTMSRQGNLYGQVSIDSKSRFVLTHGCRTKTEGPNNLRDLIVLLEKQLEITIRTIQSDDSGKLRLTWFRDFLRQNGINMVTSIADAHQQNSLAERIIRTLMDGVRVMLYVS